MPHSCRNLRWKILVQLVFPGDWCYLWFLWIFVISADTLIWCHTLPSQIMIQSAHLCSFIRSLRSGWIFDYPHSIWWVSWLLSTSLSSSQILFMQFFGVSLFILPICSVCYTSSDYSQSTQHHYSSSYFCLPPQWSYVLILMLVGHETPLIIILPLTIVCFLGTHLLAS